MSCCSDAFAMKVGQLGPVRRGVTAARSSRPGLISRARARRFAAPPARCSAPGVHPDSAAMPHKQSGFTHGPLGDTPPHRPQLQAR